QLDAFVPHLRDRGQRPVEVFLPVGEHGVDQQSDRDVLLPLRLQRRDGRSSGYHERSACDHAIAFCTFSRKAVTIVLGSPLPSASIGTKPRNPTLSMIARILARSIGVALPFT